MTDGQTSGRAPRHKRTVHECVSGGIKRVELGFTQPTYLRDFTQANAEAIRAGFCSSGSASLNHEQAVAIATPP